ncbi:MULTISPECIES: aspartate 1-decarboxylase [Propionispora]|jgi:aspartate 1-decarboxylase|uniref:Aspartate 1-decarboxylase n=2 Tax=Propionispora TaxID=112902 RepID=A0A1H8X6H3_9FIRM|nr:MULTISPECIES: aspartate 1-decarboxylase [Propionispora]SEP35499.1 L-aspartate 1-decarboxylase [Propionispora vibrioides]SHJ78262.1 L-aspartate 1-decarboxylase [Propionispora hippei DSM 15287]
MFLTSLKAKIHCATVTEANLQYMGSVTIDEALLEAAGMYPNEKVQIVNNNNGSRLETYIIKGPRDSGVICLNGAAARLVQPGDKVIIIAYAMMSEAEFHSFSPAVVMVDGNNRLVEVRHGEVHGTTG